MGDAVATRSTYYNLTNSTINETTLVSMADSENSTFEKVAKTMAYCILLVAALAGNLLIILAVRQEDRHKTVTGLLIGNMAASDLLVPVFAAPRVIVEILFGSSRWLVGGTFGEFLCKILTILQDISSAVSVYSLIAITVHRFYAVAYPLKAATMNTNVKRLIFVIWFVALIEHLPYLYAMRLSTFQEKTLCGLILPPQWLATFATAFVLSIYAIPMVLISILYILIVRKLKNQTVPGIRSEEAQERRNRRNRSVFKMSVAVVIVFFICWSPFAVYALLTGYDIVLLHPEYRFISIYLVHLNSALNFFIYYAFNTSYRQSFKRSLSCSVCPSGGSACCKMTQESEVYELSAVARRQERDAVNDAVDNE